MEGGSAFNVRCAEGDISDHGVGCCVESEHEGELVGWQGSQLIHSPITAKVR